MGGRSALIRHLSKTHKSPENAGVAEYLGWVQIEKVSVKKGINCACQSVAAAPLDLRDGFSCEL